MADHLKPTPDYQHGVEVAARIAARVLRKIAMPEDVVGAIVLAVSEARDNRPLYGAPPHLTEVEAEMFRADFEERFGPA